MCMHCTVMEDIFKMNRQETTNSVTGHKILNLDGWMETKEERRLNVAGAEKHDYPTALKPAVSE